MNQHMVDVTRTPEVDLHDEVVIICLQREETIAVEEVAELTHTISYEVLCALSVRVPRVYLRGVRAVGRTTLVEEEQGIADYAR